MESRWQLVGDGKEVEGLRKRVKGLIDMDNSVVIAGGKGDIRVLTGNGKI